MIRLVLIYCGALGLVLLTAAGCGRERGNLPIDPRLNANQVAPSPTPFPTNSPGPTPTPTPGPNVTFQLPPPPHYGYPNFTPFVSGTTAYNGAVDANRCRTYGDQLNVAQGTERLAWARRCYPGWGQWWQVAMSLTPNLYPTFGRVSETNQPYNPLNYLAPTTSTASCNMPEGYLLVGLCTPQN